VDNEHYSVDPCRSRTCPLPDEATGAPGQGSLIPNWVPMRPAGGTLAFVLVTVLAGACACMTGRRESRPSLTPAVPATLGEPGSARAEWQRPSPQAHPLAATSVESVYPELQDAVHLADVLGTPEAHLRAALEYWKLGIWDSAYGHLSSVITARPATQQLWT